MMRAGALLLSRALPLPWQHSSALPCTSSLLCAATTSQPAAQSSLHACTLEHQHARHQLARVASGAACSTSYATTSARTHARAAAAQPSFAASGMQRGRVDAPKYAEPAYFVSLHNLRDNPGARRQRIRVGRGDSARRGNYCGRGMKGQKARNTKPHILWDGGQLGLLKFPVTRERPPYEVLYNQLGLSRVVEYVKLGLLDNRRVITMKDLYDTGCVPNEIKYGVMLYSQASSPVTVPLHLQVTACTDVARAAVEAGGGSVTRVYYTAEGLKGLIKPELYTSKRLPLPLPAHSWHPRYNDKFDAIGQLPPSLSLPAPEGNAASLDSGSAPPS